jgi:SnoaL-like domain
MVCDGSIVQQIEGDIMQGIHTDSQTRALAVQYIEAVGAKELDTLASLLHQEFEFSGNAAPTHSVEPYVAAIRRLSPIIVRNDIKKVFVDGNEVCVFYDFVTTICPVASVEWLVIQEDKVRSTCLLFDRSRWPEVLQELQRLAKA